MSGRKDVFQQAMNQGHSAAWDQLWDLAARFYRQALEEFPDNPQALTNLGLALIELHEYEKALDCYRQAMNLTPDDPLSPERIALLGERLGDLDLACQASLRAAELHIKNKDATKAIASWERVNRLDPENLQARSRLALIYERTGAKQKAVSEYLAVASILQASGDLEKATHAVTKALEIIPDNEEAGRALTHLKDFKQLPRPIRPRGGTAPLRMSQVRKLQAPKTSDHLELDPVAEASQKAISILAGLLFEGLEENTVTRVERRGLQDIVAGSGVSGETEDRSRIMLHLSQVIDFQSKEENARAAEELTRAMEVGWEHPAAFFDLGYLYFKLGRVESAIRHLQRAVKHADFALGARLLLGDLQLRKGQIQEASVNYLEALKLADVQLIPPEQVSDLLQLYEPIIEVYRQQPVIEGQDQLCKNINELLMRVDWRAKLSQTRKRLPGQDEKSLPVPLAEILTEARSNKVIESLATISELSSRNKYRSAMEEAFFALQHSPTYLPLHSLMTDLLVDQGDLNAAAEKLRMIAKTYMIRGESSQAINYYRKLTNLVPSDLPNRRKLIEILVEAGQTLEAINEYMYLAEMYYSLADLSTARETYTDALRTAQQSYVDLSWRLKILHRMADIDLQSLEWRQALRVYEQIRTLQPDDEKARSYLIELNFRLDQEQQALSELDNYLAYLNSNEKQDEALRMLEYLATEYRDRISVRRRLADMYRYLRRFDDAVQQLDAIGELLLNSGDQKGAIQTLEMIIALNPPNISKYQELLDQLQPG